MSLLEIRNLTVNRAERRVLDSIHLSIQAGEVVGLIGPNGAGKSTLIKALLGFVKAESGDFKLDEKNIRGLKPSERAKFMAYLPQEREIYWPLTVERLVSLGRLPHLQPWQQLQSTDKDAIEKAMKQTDVYGLQHRPVNELAGGEKALVMLARVLAGDPQVILADEPVAGLDPHHQIQVMELLKRVTSSGKGVLVVLHDLSLSARFCDSLYLIHEGKLVSQGKPHDVLSEENLKESYHIEAKYSSSDDPFYVIPWRRL